MATATAPAPSDSATNTWKPELHEIPVDAITVGGNVRRDVGDITELAASIEASGLLSPIRVEEAGAGKYALVYGQRRLAAAKHIGLKTIPALVDTANRTGASLIVDQLLENLQRADLNALDTARAYRQLLDAGLTQRQLAERLGIAQPTIANTLAILKQPEAIQAKVASGELTRSHVEVLAKLPQAEREEVARRVVEHNLSTRDVEHEVKLAEQRQQAADRRRDEARNLADVAEASLAKKKGVTKETAKLRLYDADLGDELRGRGWTLIERTAGYGKPKGCDCIAFEVSRNYMGSSADKSVTITGACVEKAHFEAAEKNAEEVRRAALAKTEAERKEREAAARAEYALAVTPLIERLTADAQLRSRAVLWALANSNAWGEAADMFEEALDDKNVWDAIVAMSGDDVERWTLAFVVDQVRDDDQVQAAITAPVKPAKKAKAKS